ncbi:hypothetical protein [Streptacidiphilus sp. PAMC 29251]
MRRTHAAPVLALLVAVALSGCSSSSHGGSGSSGEPAIGAVPTLLSTATLSYPLDSYLETNSQVDEFTQAQNLLISRCMKTFGFDYTPEGLTVGNQPAGSANSRKYGLTDAVSAATYGYRNPVTAPAKPVQPSLSANETLALSGPAVAISAMPMSLEEEQAAAASAKAKAGSPSVNGAAIPVGGCSRESFLQLYAPKKGAVDIEFATGLAMDSFTRAEQDSRVVKAIADWSSCMAASGYHSTHPVSPQQDLGLTEATFSSPKAIDAAKKDVACKQKVNLVGIWYTVEVAYQKRVVEQNAQTLAQARTEMDERIKLADSLTR